MLKYLKHLVQLILSPGQGWTDVAATRLPYRELAASGLYPLTALTALSVFISRIYHEGLTLGHLLTDAVITFVMYFLGYFISTFVMSVFLKPHIDEGEMSEERYHTFVIYIIGLLEIITIIQNCLPTAIAITLFLPIYVAIVMWKGARYMRVRRDHTGPFMILSVLGVLLPPYILSFLFHLILPV